MNRFQWKWLFTGSKTCRTIWRPFWFAMVAILNHKWLPKYKNPPIWAKLFLAMFSHYSSFIPLVLVLFVWGTFAMLCVTVTNIYILFWGVYLYMFSCFLYPVTELVVVEFGSQLSFLKLLWNLHKSTTETCKKYSVTVIFYYIFHIKPHFFKT
jgi:hypothetical protein